MQRIGRPQSRVGPRDIVDGARFLLGLPAFLRHPIRADDARALLRRRLDQREALFLAVVRHGVFEHPSSPYRELLRLAGCEYGDLDRLVGQEGVEGALHTLYRRGVYLTVDEFKGRRPAVRGSARVAVDPIGLRSPRLATHMPVKSGGSRGAAAPMPLDMGWVRDRAVSICASLQARGGLGWKHALWSVPGGAVMGQLLQYSAFGARTERWFSQVSPSAPGLHPRYRWSTRAMRWGSLMAGAPLPPPEHVPVDAPLPIARWLAEVLRAEHTPHLFTFPSCAVRLCHVAQEAGVDIRGAKLWVGGEPVTEACVSVIRAAGAEAIPGYGSVECGLIGHGCLDPDASDDVHLLHDLHGLIQPGRDAASPELPDGALLISSLAVTAPVILLNVSLGDQAVVTRRECGCAMEQYGWATHLRTIRSYEKLTIGGMTLLDADVVRVLEEVLPARFGGGPTDYQLLEGETAGGEPGLHLLVHPAVGAVDPDAVADTFLTAIGSGSGVERVVEMQWRQAGFLRVRREPPRATASGKILHLHSDAGASGSPPRLPL